jgi:glycosyltransferase involved in cell wall biosynthesis
MISMKTPVLDDASAPPLTVLLEMRPALEGHSGIPQETRLLFRGLNLIGDCAVHGLIQSSGRVLARGLPARTGARERHAALRVDAQFNRLARVVVSFQRSSGGLMPESVRKRLALFKSVLSLTVRQGLGLAHELTRFDPEYFRDFIWRTLFDRTLSADDMDAVTRAQFRIASIPWGVMHRFGLATRALTGHAAYPRLDTRGYDVLVAETPFPARVSRGTRMVVRYHDAVPILMPHTIAEKAYHQASHYHALRANVRDGAWFSCVSEATRQDLIAIFPQAQARSVTIPNMVSAAYFREDTPRGAIIEILRTRLNARIKQAGPTGGEAPEYLLMVSTIEPRKNHLTLLSAWERLRAEGHPQLKLVLVGMLGWEYKTVVRRLRTWLDRGEVVMLEDVPSGELRQLYRHAAATVCPSLYEGFDFSGVEAMCCGGVVAASDIKVHLEIFDDASEYFNAYSEQDMARVVAALIAPSNEARRADLRERGQAVSERYAPERIIPQWTAFLRDVVAGPA